VATLAPHFSGITLQPTTRCNLNCSYCYLPDRKSSSEMSAAVVKKVADALERQQRQVQVIWHGGEPLTVGAEPFAMLLDPFSHLVERGLVTHCLQTNGTLVTDQFCDLFYQHRFRVSVSIDGPRAINVLRRNWAGREAFPGIMRGIATLQRRGINFGVIAVVGDASLALGRELYNFAADLGCDVLGIAIEETKGINEATRLQPNRVEDFWRELLSAWQERPVIRIREVDRFLSWATALCKDDWRGWSIEPFPCVAWNGDVSLLSPEFVNIAPKVGYETFVVGNLLDSDLDEILVEGLAAPYVADFLSGVDDCRRECSYFSYCGGGAASNKFFELGSTRGTRTSYCENRVQHFADVMVQQIDLPTPRRKEI
jgi:uncharacterized protein